MPSPFSPVPNSKFATQFATLHLNQTSISFVSSSKCSNQWMLSWSLHAQYQAIVQNHLRLSGTLAQHDYTPSSHAAASHPDKRSENNRGGLHQEVSLSQPVLSGLNPALGVSFLVK
jgi:hypothetical protein